MQKDKLNLIIKSIPVEPGIYQYFDKIGKIIYIGKAKNLKKRVSSYFTKNQKRSSKLKSLISHIHDIKYIVVDTEMDALLLENSIIKKYQPKYNIQLKDSKTYPWICIKNENFPRIFTTRKIIRDGSEYYGPYTSMKMAKNLLELIRELYPIRTCNHNLSAKNIARKKYQVCLEFHIGNCKGGCENLQSESDYTKDIEIIRNIIKGSYHNAYQTFEKLMLDFAKKLDFENAQIIKNKIETLKNYQAYSTVVNTSIKDVVVYSIISDYKYSYINFIQIINGCIVKSYTLEVTKKLNETDKELLKIAIVELQQRFCLNTKEIIVPFDINLNGKHFKITIPKLGDKKKLLELSIRNAKYYRKEQFLQTKIVNPDKYVNRIMTQMQEDLNLGEKPYHIECFDNSNIQGTNPTSACIVFKNGKPSKKEYRHFNIKTIKGPDDFASIKEVVYRRYKRLLDEHEDLPQLIVIDGGKGQLNAAIESIEELGMIHKVSIIGIAKRLEELFYPNDPNPLHLSKDSITLKIIQQMRNEAHRFSLRHHRNKRSKSAITSQLDEIKGIGNMTKNKLLTKFKNITNIKNTSVNELEKVIGKSKADLIYNFFHSHI